MLERPQVHGPLQAFIYDRLFVDLRDQLREDWAHKNHFVIDSYTQKLHCCLSHTPATLLDHSEWQAFWLYMVKNTPVLDLSRMSCPKSSRFMACLWKSCCAMHASRCKNQTAIGRNQEKDLSMAFRSPEMDFQTVQIVVRKDTGLAFPFSDLHDTRGHVDCPRWKGADQSGSVRLARTCGRVAARRASTGWGWSTTAVLRAAIMVTRVRACLARACCCRRGTLVAGESRAMRPRQPATTFLQSSSDELFSSKTALACTDTSHLSAGQPYAWVHLNSAIRVMLITYSSTRRSEIRMGKG